MPGFCLFLVKPVLTLLAIMSTLKHTTGITKSCIVKPVLSLLAIMSTLKHTTGITKSYTVTQRKVDHFYFYDNFRNFFSLLNSERICGGSCNYNYHLPTNLLPHYLVKCKWSTIQLHSTVNSVQSGGKYFLTTANFHGDAITLFFNTD